MAYVAIPSTNLSISSNYYSSSYVFSKYGYRARQPNRTCENLLGSRNIVSSTLSNYRSFHMNTRKEVGLLFAYFILLFKNVYNQHIPPRMSRRLSHSVDTAPLSTNQYGYSTSSNYRPRYHYGNWVGSQSGLEPSSNISCQKNISTEHVPYHGVSKHSSSSGSMSNLYKHSPCHESSTFNPCARHWRTSKHLRNSPADSLVATEFPKAINGTMHTLNTSAQYSNSEFLYGDDFQKGDLIKNRYQIVQEIGRGSFGRVYKAIDNETGKFCALKCIKDIANFRKLALEEIDILLYLAQKDTNDEYNFLHLNDHFSTRDHIFMVSDLLSINLFQLIHRNNYRGFAPKLVRKFVQCILNCLHFLHE